MSLIYLRWSTCTDTLKQRIGATIWRISLKMIKWYYSIISALLTECESYRVMRGADTDPWSNSGLYDLEVSYYLLSVCSGCWIWDQVVWCLLWLTRENSNYTWSLVSCGIVKYTNCFGRVRDLGSGSQIPVRQKVRNACHGGTIWWNDQVVTGPLKNYIWKPR